MTCNQIVLFYEKHTEGSPAEAVHEVLLALQQKGYTPTVCLEEPSDESMETIKTSYSTSISVFKSFDDQGIKSHINTLGISIGGKEYHSHKKAKEELSWSQKQSVIKSFNIYADKLSASTKTTLKFMNSITNYCGMDMPRVARAKMEKTSKPLDAQKIRSKYMAEQLQQQCEETNDYVIGLLGAGHFDVAGNLRATGLKVLDYYIVESPIEITSIDIADFCIRKNPNAKTCKGYPPFQGTVYDLHANPELNPHEEILGRILTEHHNEL